jgi:7,8-dihydroneopterin aldolase/epimerase/oxygenase
MTSSDRIFLRGLSVDCIIGFIEWERRIKQTVVIDIELPVDCRLAAVSDEVAATLDYKKVSKRIIAFVEGSQFKLVETLAHRTAMLVLEEFRVDWVRLSINKPGAIRGSRDVGIALERTRAELEAGQSHDENSETLGSGDITIDFAPPPGGIVPPA